MWAGEVRALRHGVESSKNKWCEYTEIVSLRKHYKWMGVWVSYPFQSTSRDLVVHVIC